MLHPSSGTSHWPAPGGGATIPAMRDKSSRFRSVVPGLLLFVLATSATLAGKRVSVEFDEAGDFSTYATFSFEVGTPARRGEIQQRIEAAVTRELAERGLRVAVEAPDLLVLTHVLVDRQSLDQLSDETYWEFVTGVTGVDAYDVGAGTLVVDLVDPATNKVVWRGIAVETVRESAAKIERKIDKIVGRLMRNYPPHTPAGDAAR